MAEHEINSGGKKIMYQHSPTFFSRPSARLLSRLFPTQMYCCVLLCLVAMLFGLCENNDFLFLTKEVKQRCF